MTLSILVGLSSWEEWGPVRCEAEDGTMDIRPTEYTALADRPALGGTTAEEWRFAVQVD